MPTLIDRRDFLRAAGAGFLAALSPTAFAATLDTDAVFATAFQKRDGGFGAAILSEEGKVLHTVALPERGHDITFDPHARRAVVFARQPGTFAVVFDHTGKTPPLTIHSVAGRHFYGHGVFSPDGRLLYATENDFENAAGMVGIYNATDGFRRTGEFPTYGVGPHELILMNDGQTLAIANGGIETHPDFGRAELNLATMEPSLVLVDRLTGDLIEKHTLPAAMHQLSIRHMDSDQYGLVWFGCQDRGPLNEAPQLVGFVDRGTNFRLIDLPQAALASLRNYVGSVAVNRKAGTLAVTSPQGNSLAIIDTASKEFISSKDLTEVCGVVADRAGFLATTGLGAIIGPDGASRDDPDHVWDNHLLRLPG